VGQGTYWAFFGGFMILIPVLLFGGFAAMLHGSLGPGLLMIAAILPIGIYWRVIMMRRCRDIGWPAFLPWLSFGLQFVASFSAMHSLQSMRYGAAPAPSMLSMPLLMAFVDFAFTIVIGCIGSKQPFDYATAFAGVSGSYDPPPQPSQPSQSLRPTPPPDQAGAEGGDRYDAAIARALEAHRRGDSLVGSPPPPSQPAPSGPARPAGGFGGRTV
jgi:hypothetical protein